MSQTATLSSLQQAVQQPREAQLPQITMGFGSLQSFELMQRAAKVLAGSTLVPTAYRAFNEVKEYGRVTGYEPNSAGLPNCIVALNMAQRMGADPLMVMQNLHIIEGRPSWSSTFIIAAINSCGRYSPLRFELSKPGEPREIEYRAVEWEKPANGGKSQKRETLKKITIRDQTCMAWAIEKETGERLESPLVSIQMAIDEGWLTKNGSKWQTIPELMLRYRCASFFGRLYAPELLMGLQTVEETHDFIEAAPDGHGGFAVDVESLRAQKVDEPSPPPIPDSDEADLVDAEQIEHPTEPVAEQIDRQTGEITSAEPEPTHQQVRQQEPQQGDLGDLSME